MIHGKVHGRCIAVPVHFCLWTPPSPRCWLLHTTSLHLAHTLLTWVGVRAPALSRLSHLTTVNILWYFFLVFGIDIFSYWGYYNFASRFSHLSPSFPPVIKSSSSYIILSDCILYLCTIHHDFHVCFTTVTGASPREGHDSVYAGGCLEGRGVERGKGEAWEGAAWLGTVFNKWSS